MRVAAIDLGTNTTRLLVADVVDGRVSEVVRREEITRLGESVDRLRALVPAAVERVERVLADYRRETEALGAERVLAVATSAVRDASNGQAFLTAIARSLDVTTRLLSGDEEAAMTFAGVTSDGRVAPRTLVADIGGGSTELVVAGPDGIESALSTQAGSVRLTERFLASDPPRPNELEACRAHVCMLLPELTVAHAIGVAGTVTTAATVARGASGTAHGTRLSRDSVGETLDRLARLSLAERERVPGLAPQRAPVIVAGLVVLHELLVRYSLDELTVSERDLLDGAALAAASC